MQQVLKGCELVANLPHAHVQSAAVTCEHSSCRAVEFEKTALCDIVSKVCLSVGSVEKIIHEHLIVQESVSTLGPKIADI